MPIPVACPRCGTPYNVPDEAAGQTFACANCQAPVMVGKPGSAPYPPQPASSELSLVAILAFTFVGLLGCGGIMAAIYLAAEQAAHEAARNMQCKSNLKQISLALLSYEARADARVSGRRLAPTAARSADVI
jgi:hypothetical protein